MNKDDYILRMMTKISKKRWEFFVVSRIIHSLDDPDIEFVTQQLVRRPDGKRALTDMYFPQFGVHIEIDEGQHFTLEHAEADKRREQDIVSVTEHDIWRVPAAVEQTDGKIDALPLGQIAVKTDEFILKLKSLKQTQQRNGTFVPWDFEGRYDPFSYQGFDEVAVSQNVLFRRQAEALRLFGYTGGNYQRGVWHLKNVENKFVWFPRLYKQENWDNELSADGMKIYERPTSEKTRAYRSGSSEHYSEKDERIVFARAKDVLGNTLYRYVGTFKLNEAASKPFETQFDRIRDSEKINLPPKSECESLEPKRSL